tara:strand:- start:9706 stop:9912 length:207 start_codon:yes stop_codon:yes gene_type:complete
MGIKNAVIIIDAERIIQEASLRDKSNSSEIEGIAIIVVLKSKRKIFAVNTTGKTTNNNFLSINIPFQK